MSWFYWILCVLIALASHKQILKLLIAIGPVFKGLSERTAFFQPTQLIAASVFPRSIHYIPSSINEQHELSVFESKLLKFKTKTVSKNKKKPSTPQKHLIFPDLSQVSDSTFSDLSRTIYCANDLLHNPEMKIHCNCEVVKEIKKNRIFGLKTGTYVIFAFRSELETELSSACKFRVHLHRLFVSKIWPVLKAHLQDVKGDREIYFVGYGSGGSLASLAAWHTINWLDKNDSSGIIKNADNRIKVVTWDELPMFTRKSITKSPLLPRNHLRLVSSNSNMLRIAELSGGTDELNYFSTTTEGIQLNSNEYDRFHKIVSNSNMNNNNLKGAVINYLKEERDVDFDGEALDRLEKLVALNHLHLSTLYLTILNSYRSTLSNHFLKEPEACATALASQLSNSVFLNSKIIITCRVDDFDPNRGTFKLFCSHGTTQILSFNAILGTSEAHESGNDCLPFMEKLSKKQMKKYKKKSSRRHGKKKHKKRKSSSSSSSSSSTSSSSSYSSSSSSSSSGSELPIFRFNGSEPKDNRWSRCIYDLFTQQPQRLQTLQPYSNTPSNPLPQCSYLSLDANKYISSDPSHVSKNSGCYLQSNTISEELYRLYSNDPKTFYSLIDPDVMKFPKSCYYHLIHISKNLKDNYSLKARHDLAVKYITELISTNPIRDTEVTLWQHRDTRTFETTSFFSSDAIPVTELSNRAYYPLQFENKLIECISNESYEYHDCTNPVNRWIINACPTICTSMTSSLSTMESKLFCKNVKICPNAGYYVSVSDSNMTAEDLTKIKNDLSGINHQIPQYGVFTAESRIKSIFGTINFTIWLFRIRVGK